MRTVSLPLCLLALTSAAAGQSLVRVVGAGDAGFGGTRSQPYAIGVDDQGRVSHWDRVEDAAGDTTYTLSFDGRLLVATGLPVSSGATVSFLRPDLARPFGEQVVSFSALFSGGCSLLLNTKVIPGGCGSHIAANSNGQVALRGTDIRVLTLDASGNVLDQRSFPTTSEASLAAGSSAFGPFEQMLELNEAGDVLYEVLDTTEELYVNGQVLVQRGGASPLAGATWSRFNGGSINVHGEAAFDALLQNGVDVVATKDRIVAASGASIPAIGSASFFSFRYFGGAEDGPEINDEGDVLYYALYEEDDVFVGQGLFLEDEQVLSVGETPFVGTGAPMGGIYGFEMSPNGRFVVINSQDVSTSTWVNTSGLVDLGRVASIPGCSTSPAKLSRMEGFAVAGGTVVLGMDGAQANGALGYVLISDAPVVGYPPCGLLLPFGELVVDVAGINPLVTVTTQPWQGGAVPAVVSILNDQRLVDHVFYAQGVFVAPGSSEPVRLTNALEIEVGAP